MPQVKLLIGTRKAAFVYTSDDSRQKWELSKPMIPGWQIYHMAADLRDRTPRFYAAGNHMVWGPVVAKSVDGGETWATLETKSISTTSSMYTRIDFWGRVTGHRVRVRLRVASVAGQLNFRGMTLFGYPAGEIR